MVMSTLSNEKKGLHTNNGKDDGIAELMFTLTEHWYF